MALMGDAAMAVIYDLESGWDAKHDDWHSHEHMLERVSIPGFLRGRRCVAVGDGPRCFVLYEAESLDVLTSDAYLERLNNPTPWTQTVVPRFRNTVRTLCRITVSAGRGVGGTLAFVALSPDPARSDELWTWIQTSAAPVTEQPGAIGVHLLEGDDRASRIETREKTLRGASDAVADWLLVVEGYDAVESVLAAGPLGRDALLEHGAASVGHAAGYALGALLAKEETP